MHHMGGVKERTWVCSCFGTHYQSDDLVDSGNMCGSRLDISTVGCVEGPGYHGLICHSTSKLPESQEDGLGHRVFCCFYKSFW